MSLDERSDELDKRMAESPIEKNVQILMRTAKQNRNRIRLLAISLFLDFILTIGFALVTYKTNQVASLAQSNRQAVIQNCETANESRKAQRELWAYVSNLTPEQPRSTGEEERSIDFDKFVAKTFAERDCQAEINKT